MKDLNFESFYRLTVFLVFATLFVYILSVGQSIIAPLVIAFFLAFLLIPVSNFFERKLRFPRSIAAIVCIILTIVLIGGALTLFGTQVNRFINELDDIADRLKEIKSDLPPIIASQFDSLSTDELLLYVKNNSGKILTRLSSIAAVITLVFIIPVYIVMILIYRNLLGEFLIRVLKIPHTSTSEAKEIASNKGVSKLLINIKTIIQKYIIGMFYVICVLFVLNSIALISLGIGHAFLFAAFAAVLNVIPFVGPLIGSTLPIMFALITKDSLFYPVAVMVSFIFIQSLESNLITPKIVGSNVSLNPLVTLITLFVGASIWGLVGMILFIPIVAIIKEILRNIDGLEPYAYLLGNEDEETKQNIVLEKVIKKIKGKIIK